MQNACFKTSHVDHIVHRHLKYTSGHEKVFPMPQLLCSYGGIRRCNPPSCLKLHGLYCMLWPVMHTATYTEKQPNNTMLQVPKPFPTHRKHFALYSSSILHHMPEAIYLVITTYMATRTHGSTLHCIPEAQWQLGNTFQQANTSRT